MDVQTLTVLVLSGKSAVESNLAGALKSAAQTLTLTLAESEHTNIRVFLPDDLDSIQAQPTFASCHFLDALSTNRFGRFLVWCPAISSTHDLVSQNFAKLPVGSVCVADVQLKGRGRVKNVWESPPGCLMFSFTSQMVDGRKLPLFQYVVSLAVTEGVKELCQAKGFLPPDVRIKWPNDLYLNGLKIGGILCTSTYREKKFDVCAGIGLNVDNERPTTCLNVALQEMNSTSFRLSREDLLASFFNKFEYLFEIFLEQGFQVLEDLYYATWLHSGQKVVVEEKDGQSTESNIVIVQGVTASGYLLAVGEDNKFYELHPDGNSFDFFKGLVRRKLH